MAEPSANAPQGALAPGGVAAAELSGVLTLVGGLEPRVVNVGHDRKPASLARAQAFLEVWCGSGGQVGAVVSWPQTAASWLRPAIRLADDADTWVVADVPHGWAGLGPRLAATALWDRSRPHRRVRPAGRPRSAARRWPHRHRRHPGRHRHRARMALPPRAAHPRPSQPRPPHRRHQDDRDRHGREDPVLELIPRPRRQVAPGVVHVPGWLEIERQTALVETCRDWARRGPGARRAALPGGARMSVSTVCLGWHWIPYRYSATRDDQDGSPVIPFPGWLGALGAAAVADAYENPAAGVAYRPDVALVNFYDGDARLGMHQDREELAPDRVVSLSLGAACVFRIAGPEHRGRPWCDLELCSGDMVVFGRENRLVYHGVPKLLPDHDVPDIGLEPGVRINITLRASGLDPP